MKRGSCVAWTDGLADVALGSGAPPELRRHLASCPECDARLRTLELRSADLDRDLRQLTGGAEPPPELRARILRRVDDVPVRRTPRPAWVVASAAAVLLGGLLVARTGWREPRRPDSVSLSAWRSPTERLLRSPAEGLLHSPSMGDFYFPLDAPSPDPGEGEPGDSHEG